MIEIVQAPNYSKLKGIELFLAGGISNCPNWQLELSEKIRNDQTLIKLFKRSNLIVYNPRCKELPNENPQIIWEFDKLKKSKIISFWFSNGSVNPITLFEYGSHFKDKKKKIIIGCDNLYERKNNVILQTELAMPNLEVMSNFDDFFDAIKNEILKTKKRKFFIWW